MITQQQLERRRKYLGSSDAAAIIGLDQYRTAADVYWDKLGKLAPDPRVEQRDVIQVGNYCESAVLKWFAEHRGIKILTNSEIDTSAVHANGVMAANLDAVVVDHPDQALEAKTHGVVSLRLDEAWGETGTDEVPERVAIQCQHQMAVLPSLRVVWVPVLLGGVGFRFYRVERNDALIESLTQAELRFWSDHVLSKTPPQDSLPSMEVLKRIRREPKSTVTIPDDLVLNWQELKSVASEADKAAEEAKRAVLDALGDAEAGESAFGTVTYLEATRKEYIVQASTYRTMRFKKRKD